MPKQNVGNENFDLSFLENTNQSQVQQPVQAQQVPVQPSVTQAAPVQPAAQQIPVQQSTTVPQPSATVPQNGLPFEPGSPAPLSEDTINEAEELAAMYKPQTIAMGSQYSSFPLPKFKSKDSITSRISIIGGPFVIEAHYHEGAKKSVICTTKQGGSGLCCAKLPQAATRYCFPVVKHSVGMDGITAVQGEPSIEILAVGYSGYQSLAAVFKSQGNTFDGYDLLVDTTDARYQKNSYTATRDTYLTQEMKQKALAYFNKNADKWYQCIGKICSDAEINQIANTQAPTPPPDRTITNSQGWM